MSSVDQPQPWDVKKLSTACLSNGQGILLVDGVGGFLFHAEVDFFIENIAKSIPPGGTYLEIGSFMGLSASLVGTTLIKEGNTKARIYCVDTWQGSDEHQTLDVVQEQKMFNIFLNNVVRTNVAEIVNPCRGKSVEVAKNFPDHSLDVIFVDGDHTYEGCLADMEAWYPKLKKGGRFLGHDALPEENPTCGVRRAVENFCVKYDRYYNLFEPPVAHFVWEVTEQKTLLQNS